MVVRRLADADLKFELQGRILVTKDFLHERWIALSASDFDVERKPDSSH
jgi:hypothetical protein